jgi:hypothetical protein
MCDYQGIVLDATARTGFLLQWKGCNDLDGGGDCDGDYCGVDTRLACVFQGCGAFVQQVEIGDSFQWEDNTAVTSQPQPPR